MHYIKTYFIQLLYQTNIALINPMTFGKCANHFVSTEIDIMLEIWYEMKIIWAPEMINTMNTRIFNKVCDVILKKKIFSYNEDTALGFKI